jgi:hypothetical protein
MAVFRTHIVARLDHHSVVYLWGVAYKYDSTCTDELVNRVYRNGNSEEARLAWGKAIITVINHSGSVRSIPTWTRDEPIISGIVVYYCLSNKINIRNLISNQHDVSTRDWVDRTSEHIERLQPEFDRR